MASMSNFGCSPVLKVDLCCCLYTSRQRHLIKKTHQRLEIGSGTEAQSMSGERGGKSLNVSLASGVDRVTISS